MKITRQDNVDRLVEQIASRSGLELTTDNIAVYGGWQLAEGNPIRGGINTSTFGSRRRPYGLFIDYLEAILIGLRCAEAKRHA